MLPSSLFAACVPAALSAQMIGGLVVDSATMRPLSGARVTALDVAMDTAVAETLTDSTGIFYIQLRQAGTYRLKFDVVPTTLTLGDTLVIGPDDYIERKFVLALPTDPEFSESQVDKQVRPKQRTVRLRYPVEARELAISGTVVVTYVVDKQGRVERENIRILKSPDERLSRAVIDVLRETSFYPAEYRGKPVRQAIQQPFNFCHTPGGDPKLPPPACP